MAEDGEILSSPEMTASPEVPASPEMPADAGVEITLHAEMSSDDASLNESPKGLL